jgi:hypothetical protein
MEPGDIFKVEIEGLGVPEKAALHELQSVHYGLLYPA